MNKEKLLEMAKECDYGITGYIHNDSKVEYEVWGGSMETYKLNKFAELIIEECINTIKMGMTRDGHDTTHYKQSMKHIKNIEEVFNLP